MERPDHAEVQKRRLTDCRPDVLSADCAQAAAARTTRYHLHVRRTTPLVHGRRANKSCRARAVSRVREVDGREADDAQALIDAGRQAMKQLATERTQAYETAIEQGREQD